jgi:hypothetical protein
MNMDIVFLTSSVVMAVATGLLAVFFSLEFFAKRLRATGAWACAFWFYFFGLVVDLVVLIFEEIPAGKAALFAGLMMLALAMTLFYYGTSLLFFGPGSFYREKMSILVMLIYTVYSAYLIMTLPEKGFREAVIAPIQLGLMTPIFFVIAVLFYRVSMRLAPKDPRRRTILLVAGGWFLTMVNAIGRGAATGISSSLDSVISVIGAIGWLLVLYGMALGKAAKT